ncbi:MAG: hypothetical protein JXB29_08610 [Sedimentisphaerales bacterium]|nr:hypothetical protein [Sedimentisphaerales bacterium]
MDFLSTVMWWVFFIIAALFYFISSFGHHTRGTKSPQIEAFGSFGMVVFIILTFVFLGWKGCIGIILALLTWAVISERIMWNIWRKLSPYTHNLDYSHFVKRSRFAKSPSKLPTTWEELLEQGNNTDEMLLKISNQPKTIEVLRRYGKTPADIRDIFCNLCGCGCSEYVTQSVIESQKLLSEYLQMKTDGVSDLEIAYELSQSLGGP